MKLTAAIIGTYPNALIKAKGYEGTFKIHGISFKYQQLEVMEVDTGDHWDIDITDCQLLLTPLSKISDEDAVEVCKFLYSNPALHNPERGKSVATVGDWHSTRKGVEVIDYLRSKGYDCGHGSIPSLIAAGVAVEKK